MMENEEGMNHLLIHVLPEENKTKNEKLVAFFLVINNSASMNEYVGKCPTINFFNGYINEPLKNTLPWIDF